MALRTPTTSLRRLELSDADVLLELRLRNRDFLAPFEPARPAAYFTRAAQRQELRDGLAGWDAGRDFTFGIFEGDELIGRLRLTQVARGAFQNAILGYFVDEDHCGRGHATAAVRLALDFAFDSARLHRVQAAVMPRNTPSIRVLEKSGFRAEGFAPRYLCIDGIWEDHRLYAVTAEDHRAAEGG
jgi:ribosomal-protein-alanine N-acetyltransferase